MPLDLKLIKIACFRFISKVKVPPSTMACLNKQANSVLMRLEHTSTSFEEKKTVIRRHFLDIWNAEWLQCQSASITKEFFPSVNSANVLRKSNPSFEVMKMLTGHSFLNKFLCQIKIRSSPLCNCKLDEESSHHFIFDCQIFHVERTDLKVAVEAANLIWPPNFSDIPSNNALWKALVSFVKKLNA